MMKRIEMQQGCWCFNSLDRQAMAVIIALSRCDNMSPARGEISPESCGDLRVITRGILKEMCV